MRYSSAATPAPANCMRRSAIADTLLKGPAYLAISMTTGTPNAHGCARRESIPVSLWRRDKLSAQLGESACYGIVPRSSMFILGTGRRSRLTPDSRLPAQSARSRVLYACTFVAAGKWVAPGMSRGGGSTRSTPSRISSMRRAPRNDGPPAGAYGCGRRLGGRSAHGRLRIWLRNVTRASRRTPFVDALTRF